MSDRMPEDLPVTICINVMLGITRSKVILTLIYYLLSLFTIIYYLFFSRFDSDPS